MPKKKITMTFFAIVNMTQSEQFPNWESAFADWHPRVQEFVGGASLTQETIQVTCYIKGHFVNKNGATMTISLRHDEVMGFARSLWRVSDDEEILNQSQPVSESAVLEAYLAHIDRAPGADRLDWV